MKHLKYNFLLFIAFFIAQTLWAQKKEAVDFSKSLKIGDRFVPPNGISVFRGNMVKFDWNTLKDKVIILDFFSTACSTCIDDMPKLQKLQDKYKDRLQIFNVAFQDKATLEKFYTENTFLKEKKVNLPVIHNDGELKKMFPHWAEPHAVIIYKGIVQAITFSRLLTEENILKLLRDGRIELPYKNDYNQGDLGVHSSKGQGVSHLIGVWLSGYQNGVRTVDLKYVRDSITGLYKSSFYNRSIYIALRNVWSKFEMPTYIPRDERVVWKVKDSTRFHNFKEDKDKWNVDNAISYERLDKVMRSDSLQARVILQDLHSLLSIRSYKTMMKRTCLILKSCPVKPYAGQPLKNPLNYENSSVLGTIIDIGMQFPPVIDQVNRNEKITVGDFSNLAELNQQLAVYGIKAEIGEGEIEVLVIEEVR